MDYVVYREDEFFVAQCLNVDVSSLGATRAEAAANLKEAVELCFEGESGEAFKPASRSRATAAPAPVPSPGPDATGCARRPRSTFHSSERQPSNACFTRNTRRGRLAVS